MQNFNMSFSNNKADVLIHLTQWQYWWWFWFAFLWVLYYLLVARVFRYRTLKFNPRISSTLRPHGKWGDLLTCLIPVTWCVNILVNSNFILKLIEWQSESSLFTLRVRAKQWYWIYKLDLRNIADIFSAPRNIGRNKWQFSTFGDLQTAEDYLHLMQMRAYNNWSKDFWSELGKKTTKRSKYSIVSSVDVYKSEVEKNQKTAAMVNFFEKKNLFLQGSVLGEKCFYTNNILHTSFSGLCNIFLQKKKKNFTDSNIDSFFKRDLVFLKSDFESSDDRLFKLDVFKKNQKVSELKNSTLLEKQTTYITKIWSLPTSESFKNFLNESLFDCFFTSIKHPDLDDETRLVKRNFGKITPIRILKYPKGDFFFKDGSKYGNIDILKFRFGEQKPVAANKPIRPTIYLTFKQKRYNQRNVIGKKTNMFFDKNLNKIQKYSGNPFLKNMSIIEENYGNPTKQYRMVKKAKSRLDTTRVAGWNRLLRSRRILVLPAHVNITVITNSFDIVHSWYIPGLGLKMDCLPGRATHHTLYIDNVGLYYGQCAEICGRYHHHMPIRVCALPFEHFLVWWHTFGLPKFLFTSDDKNVVNASKYFTRKFSW